MADITMCTGENCERKGECYRYNGPKNPYRQAFFAKPPLTRWGCEWFLKEDKDNELCKMEP